MAFSVKGNPLSCDAASVAAFNAALVSLGWDKKQLFVRDVAWFETNAIGDELILTDGKSDPIVKAKVDEPNEDFKFGNVGVLRGLQVTKLDSGTLFIYLK